MSLLKLLEQAQGGQGLSQLASQFGLDEGQAGGLAKMLAPAIGSAAKKRAEGGGAADILNALQGEAQGGLFDDAAAAAAPEAQAQGANFLDQILGGTSARQDLAMAASERSGVEQSKVDQFMPALAAMLQGGMQKQTPDSSIQSMLGGLGGLAGGGQSSSGGGGIMGMLGGLLGGRGRSQDQTQDSGGALGGLMSMLDADGDGSVLDDVLDRVMK